MLTYKKIMKITYCIIVAGVLGVVCLLLKERALNGNYGQFTALAAVFVFLAYAGVIVKRLVNKGKDDEALKKYIEELDMKEWSNYHQRIKECRSKISYVRHDLANHIQTFNNLKESVKCAYPSERMEIIQKELDRHSNVQFCDNMLLELAIDGKLAELENKGIVVNADICLRDMKEYECELLCMYLWFDIDKAVDEAEKNAGLQNEGRQIWLNIKNGVQTEEACVVKWSVGAKGVEPLVGMLEVKRKNG